MSNKQKLIEWFKRNWFYNLLLVIFILFIFIKSYQFIIGIIILLLIGIHSLFKGFKTRENLEKFIGLSLCGLAISSLITNFNISLGLLIFLATSIILIWFSKKLPYIKLILLFIFFISSFSLIYPLTNSMITLLFSKQLLNNMYPLIFLSIIAYIFILYSQYSFLKEILLILDTKYNIFKTKNNIPYLITALMLIIFILIVGISEVRKSYIEIYPFEIKNIQNSEDIYINNCISLNNKEYLVSDDTIKCDLVYPINISINVENSKLYIRKNEISIYEEMNNTDWFIKKNETGMVTSIIFRLNKNIKDYDLYLDYNKNFITTSALNFKFNAISLSEDEYNKKIGDRFNYLIAVFSFSLFSIFSAIYYLKKIISD
ncbi:MAG: hypothetical protein PHF86_12025 [Candidatus Nanoarchaeia archaeon]|nr:hypothetical protein [Candidatus Nanoarchaeia archaeon]